jgi:GNAT superfamily N-acetyltransferase
LGCDTRSLRHARIVVDPLHPNVWDANHADSVSAETEDEIGAVLKTLDVHLAHSDWRVIHTDPLTPEPFVARIAHDGFEERLTVIQMALGSRVYADATTNLHSVESDGDWSTLAELVAQNHSEGQRSGGATMSREVTNGICAGYRAKSPACRFHLAMVRGEAVGYGSFAAGPSGAGIIEDLFTLPSHRGRGVASGMIAAFADRMRGMECHTVFLGAIVGGHARHLYARLGFQPVMFTRTWVKQVR